MKYRRSRYIVGPYTPERPEPQARVSFKKITGQNKLENELT